MIFGGRENHVALSERQIKALNRVLDEFDQPSATENGQRSPRLLRIRRYETCAHLWMQVCSSERAGGGRSAAYWLVGVPLPEAAAQALERPLT